jgi:MFS family permease
MLSFLREHAATPRPGFHRWHLPPAAMALQFCLGQAYALGALYRPVMGLGAAEQAGLWVDGLLNGVFTLAMVMLGLSAAVAGGLIARIGAQATAFVASLFFCVGLAVAGFAVQAENAPLFFVGYGVIAGIGLGLGYVAPMQLLIDWFPDRRGLATGLAVTGFGGGAILATALSSALTGMFQSGVSSGVGETLIALSLIYAVIMFAACLGLASPPAPRLADEPALGAAEAQRTPQFYLIWGLLFINVVAGITLLASAPGMLSLAMGRTALAAEIAGFVALLGVSNMVGRFLISAASDYLGRKNTVMLLLITGCLLHLSTPLMAARLNLPLTVLEYMLMVMVYGGLFAVMPAYVSDVFGNRFTGAIHGRILTAWSAGALFVAAGIFLVAPASWSLTDLRDMKLDTFYATSLLFLIAIVINLAIKPAVHEPGAAQDVEPDRYKTSRHHVKAWGSLGVLVLAGLAWTMHKSMQLPLSWQIGATLLPLLLGAGVCIAFFYMDRSRFAVRGVVGPYFAALALLFGLFASLMANEVWQKTSRVNDLLDTQVSALQSLSAISQSIAPGDERVPQAVRAFTEGLLATDRDPPNPSQPPAAVRASLQQLYAIGADTALFSGHAPQNSSYMSALETLRMSYLERSTLRHQSHDSAKLVSLLIFGFLTQIAIAFCHAGNQRAISASVMLFSVGFSVAVAVMALLDGAIRYADAAGVIPYLGPPS